MDEMGSSKEYYQNYNAKKYAACKELGICVRCATNIAMDGYSMCSDCLYEASEKQRKRQANITEEQIEARKEYQRERRKRFSDSGRCTACGRPNNTEYKYCLECRLNQRKRDKKRKNQPKHFAEIGLCPICGKVPVNGYAYCEEHLQKKREIMAQNRSKKSFKNRDLLVDI